MTELSEYFGPSERNKGAQLLRKDQVRILSASDTQVRAVVKASAPARVNLQADEVGAPDCTANCSCAQGQKGELCKHICAVVLKLEETGGDFLQGRTQIRAEQDSQAPARQAKADGFKTKQRELLKERNKEMRLKKKREGRVPKFSYPAPVQESIDYFAANGFPMEELDLATILNARKLLSRVFHPDKGGTHAEVLELNQHFDCLQDYLKS